MESPVDVITQKQVVDVGALPSHLEDLQQIIKLTMNVPHYRHGSIYSLNVALLHKDLPHASTERLNFLLLQQLTIPQLID